MMDAVMIVNLARARLVGQRLQRILALSQACPESCRRVEGYDSLEGLRVGILGLTYKPGTSTLRRSIALEIIHDLVAQGASVKAFDPLARLDEVTNLPPFESCADPYAAAQGSDALVLVTEWAGIRDLDLPRLRTLMRRPVFIDTRNVFDPATMQEAGFIYLGVGRGLGADSI
jgi:UDPglucose 6-dehydrogenase